MHLLVVEDDRSLADLLRRGLTQERHVVDVAHDGTRVWSAPRAELRRADP